MCVHMNVIYSCIIFIAIAVCFRYIQIYFACDHAEKKERQRMKKKKKGRKEWNIIKGKNNRELKRVIDRNGKKRDID